MPRLTDTDLERSFLDEFAKRLDAPIQAEEIVLDEPGMLFRVKGRGRWVEPRLTSLNPSDASVRGVPDEVLWTIRCFVKVESKGERQLVLSEVVDHVRRAVDPRFAAGAMRIRDEDGQQLGILQLGSPSEVRAYNQTINVRDGVPIVGVSVATLTLPCQLDSSGCLS